MKQLALLLVLGLMAASILACGGDSAEPTEATAPIAVATQPPAAPTDTPAPTQVPEPTAAPTNTPQATPAPEPTEPPPTAVPTAPPAPTETPTAVPDPTATPEPEPTATATPQPTAIPAPTAVPEPSIAADVAPLGNNLLFVAYLDRATQTWQVYDHSGEFKPEDILLPPGMTVPRESDIVALTELIPDEVYIFELIDEQTVEMNGNEYTIYAGGDYVVWR